MAERFEFTFGSGRESRPRDDDAPMRLVVVGDFSGAPAAERPPLASRPTHKIDLDNLDAVMRRLAPRVTLPSGGTALSRSGGPGEVRFEQIDDFHPDRLYARLALFQALRHARANPPAGTDATVGRLLGRPSPSAASSGGAAPADPIQALIHRIVAPYIVQDVPAQSAAYAAAVDSAIAEQMRTVLHEPSFQSLEAAWRGVQWLIANLELDEHLELHLFDVTRDELLGDVVAAEGKLADTGLHQAVVERWRGVPGAQRWSALVTLMEFGSSVTDVGLLAALGLIAAQAAAPLLGGADRSLSQEPATAAGWQALRRSEAAQSIALAAPRVLLRLPYGKQTDPIDSFAFEEFAGPPVHDQFLWGSGALALAILLGRAFTARGWDMEPGDEREIDGLPAYTFMRDGEPELQACAEHYLTERQIQAMLEAGLIPLASRRDRNAIVAIRFQSVSDPPAPLRW
jgi:type VI secretion system protein ImpC